MRTNIVLDDDLIKQAFKYSEGQTKKALIHEALRAFIALRQRRSLLDLQGKIRFKPNYNHKAARA